MYDTVFALIPNYALGSILTTFNAVAGSAAVQGNQVYGPYGNSRYSQGAMGTNKGFTGQYADATGLDYYNARYYDPVVGRFLSADVVQGNDVGMDPYGYVGGNPETLGDPTGQSEAELPMTEGGGDGGGSSGGGGVDSSGSRSALVTDTPLGTSVTMPGEQPDVFTSSGNTTYQMDPQTGRMEKITETDSGRVVSEVDPNTAEYQDVAQQLDNTESDQSSLRDHEHPVTTEPTGTVQSTPPLTPPTTTDATTAGNTIRSLKSTYTSSGRPGAVAQLDTNGEPIVRTSGTRILDDNLGNVQCAEGFCLKDVYDNSNITLPGQSGGINKMYVFQVRGLPPCLDYCIGDLQDASLRFGPFRVWFGLNRNLEGILQYVDFVNGEIYGPLIP